jgi:putative FmdB family regulatory protein
LSEARFRSSLARARVEGLPRAGNDAAGYKTTRSLQMPPSERTVGAERRLTSRERVIKFAQNFRFEDFMPIYEYKCAKCGTFEATQRITDKPLAKCPTCKGKVKKLISNTSFQLKGSGWYITDYARKDKGGDGKTDKAETKSDSKTEPKKSESSSTAAEKNSTSAASA